jgi:hypothetical protein
MRGRRDYEAHFKFRHSGRGKAAIRNPVPLLLKTEDAAFPLSRE